MFERLDCVTYAATIDLARFDLKGIMSTDGKLQHF